MDPESFSVISYFVVFGAGLALSFSPCVFPLVPVVTAVIGSSGELSRRKNFFLALVYVAGMALTFSFLGAAAALTGSLFGQMQTNPFVNLIIGNIILLFAFSVLGIVDLPFFSLRGSGSGKFFSGGGVLPVFTMGLSSGFLGAACVGPVLGSVLLYTASAGNIFLGFSLLFVFALGLGTLLVIAGAFTGLVKNFTGAGRAMNIVQKTLGVGMIFMAQYYIFSAGKYALDGWF